MRKSTGIFFAVILLLLTVIGVQNSAGIRQLFRSDRLFQPNNTAVLPPANAPQAGSQGVITDQTTMEKVIQQTLPSVVTVGVRDTSTSGNNFRNDPFNPFSPPQSQSDKPAYIGSGFIISSDGLVVTNKHVVSDIGFSYNVIANDNKVYPVQKIYRDPLNDLAILQISAQGLTPLPLGDSSQLKLGTVVMAMGTPLGQFQNTVSQGIISGLGRGITAGSPFSGSVEQLNNVIQTDAPISPGNSGGPLVDLSGNAVGINTAVASEGQNIGFAIPVNTVKEMIQNFQRNGNSFQQGFLGIRYQMIDEETAIQNNVPQGAYVVSVVQDSPADKAGIQARDIITEFDGNKIAVSNEKSLSQLIALKKSGERVNIALWRNGNTTTVQATLQNVP